MPITRLPRVHLVGSRALAQAGCVRCAAAPAALGVDRTHAGKRVEPGESVTWEDCPHCRRPAAVGWVGGRPTEFDCPRGCRLSTEQLHALAARRARPPVDGPARSAALALSEPGVLSRGVS